MLPANIFIVFLKADIIPGFGLSLLQDPSAF
jgi:hypothetical protein